MLGQTYSYDIRQMIYGYSRREVGKDLTLPFDLSKSEEFFQEASKYIKEQGISEFFLPQTNGINPYEDGLENQNYTTPQDCKEFFVYTILNLVHSKWIPISELDKKLILYALNKSSYNGQNNLSFEEMILKDDRWEKLESALNSLDSILNGEIPSVEYLTDLAIFEASNYELIKKTNFCVHIPSNGNNHNKKKSLISVLFSPISYKKYYANLIRITDKGSKIKDKKKGN